MVEKHKSTLKKEKEQWAVAEKVRKEKWEQEKRIEIRQGTVQQLQPTIQNLLDKNKEELRGMEEHY